jgi:predicted ATPase
LELHRAECEFLTGQLSVAEGRLAALSNRATTTVEQAIAACSRMDVCAFLDQTGRAVAVCLDYLRHVGIEYSPHPKDEEVRREYERIWSQLGGQTIEDLIDLPPMKDPASFATVDVLSKVLSPALHTDANLASLTICKAVGLSLEHGNCDASCLAYVMLGRIAGPRFGDYKAGFRFGQLGYELVERRGLKRFEASTYECFAVFVMPWMKHVRECRAPRFRSGEPDRKPHVWSLHVHLSELGPSLRRRAAARGATRSQTWPRIRREGAVRHCHSFYHTATRADSDAPRLDAEFRLL